MGNQVAKQHGLALLAESEHRVELLSRLVRHDAAQETDIAGRHLHVHHEVGTGQGEQQRDPPCVEQDGVDVESAGLRVAHGERERILLVAVDDFADDVGGLVAVEGRVEHLDLAIDLHFRPISADECERGPHDVVDIARQIFEWALPVEILDDAPDRAPQAVVLRVVARIDGRKGVDVLGRDRRPRENVVVVEVGPMQDLAAHRVEEGLGELRLLMIDQQADVLQLDLLPGGIVEGVGIKFGMQAGDGFLDTVVVELDAVANGVELSLPVTGLVEFLGAPAGFTKDPVVLVEALDQCLRDRLGDRDFVQ